MFILENFKDIERMITSPTIPSPQSNCHVFGLYSSVLLLSFSHPRWAHILVIQYSTYHFNEYVIFLSQMYKVIVNLLYQLSESIYAITFMCPRSDLSGRLKLTKHS